MATSAALIVPWVLTAVVGGAGSVRGPHHPRGHHANHQHHQPTTDTKITADTQLLRDVHHIKEDLGEYGLSGEALRALTPEELDFHYFKLHDFDNNTKLDGLEILQAIQHTVHREAEGGEEGDRVEKGSGSEGSGGGEGAKRSAPKTDDDDMEYFIELIDQVLAEDDRDGDGYLSYMEYVVARQKEQTTDSVGRSTQKAGRVERAVHTHTHAHSHTHN